jgi:hypothetical protein
MSIWRGSHRVVFLAFLVTLLAGCQFYWGKSGATAQQFETDSRECAKEAYPTPQLAASGSDSSQRIYRACLRARGGSARST